jgi:hypothetical protein
MPTSCADLKKVGHIWNGIYSVIGPSTVETIYCDFTKPVNDPGKLYTNSIFIIKNLTGNTIELYY